MQPAHVVIVLACDQHADTILRMLDDSRVGNWVVMEAGQARRVGQLQYTSLWPSTSPQVIVGFGEEAAVEEMLRRLMQAAHAGKVCAACTALTWQARQTEPPSLATDPVCRTAADRGQSISESYRGTTYHFCSKYCRERFVGDPERYVPRRGEEASRVP